eukprot:gb/GECG01014866.1/.p1 GENE.gb/GECG01014866.1/~~gb/GECG01014866.1/.p1  ORF type:complete len:3652 (+),score=422.49 gb/GECG01014866.1/:1-10956(+)
MEALEELANASSPYSRAVAAHQLRYRVTTLSKEMPADSFLKFINYLIKRISELLNAPQDTSKMAGVYAIYELISAQTKEVDVKSQVVRFANYLRTIIGLSTADPAVLKMAAKAIGRLAAVGSTVAPSFLGFEINRALERLEYQESSEGQLFSSVSILREAAENAPTLFYKSIERFFKNVWTALSHSKPLVRESAAKTLGSCLKLTKRRKSQRHDEYCEDIYSNALTAFNNSGATWEAIHGALLALRELIMHADEFCSPKFTEICSCALKYRDVRDRLIRGTIIDILPRLAAFDPNGFVHGYVDLTLEYLLGTLRDLQERGPAFVAVGSVALAVKDYYPLSSLRPQLDKIVSLIKEALTPKRNRPFCTDALKCVAMLSDAVGPSLITYMHDLLEPMFAAGLTPELTHALKQLVSNIPPLLELIQERLLHEVSFILSGKPFPPPGQEFASFLPSNAPAAVSAASKAATAHRFRSRSHSQSAQKEGVDSSTDHSGSVDGSSSGGNKIGRLMGESVGSMSAAAAAVAAATNRDTMDMGLEYRGAQVNSAMIKSQQAFMGTGPDSREIRSEKSNIAWTRSMLAGTATGGGGAAITNAKFSMASPEAASQSGASGSSSLLSMQSKKSSQPLLTRVQRISLALRTLATFDFRGISLLPFVRHIVLLYADDPDLSIRRDAIVTTSMLLVSPSGCRLDKATVTSEKRRWQQKEFCSSDGQQTGSQTNGATDPGEIDTSASHPAGIRNLNRNLQSVLFPEAWYLFLDRDLEPYRGEKLRGEVDDSLRWNVNDTNKAGERAEHKQEGSMFVGGVLPVVLMDAGPTLELVNEILQRLIMAAVGDPHPYIRMLTLQCLGAGMRVLSITGKDNPQLIKPEGLYTLGTNWAIEYQPKHHVVYPFGSLEGGWFDALLAQPVALRTLCFSLHDEHHSVREMAVFLLGRLTHRNPSGVMPSLRRLLMEILQELELGAPARNSKHNDVSVESWKPEKMNSMGASNAMANQYLDSIPGYSLKDPPRDPVRDQEQAVRLLGFVIKAAHRLVSPYVRPILRTLLPKLAIDTVTRSNRNPEEEGHHDAELELDQDLQRDESDDSYRENENADMLPLVDSNLVSSALSTLGELSEIGAESMLPYFHKLTRLIIHTIGNRGEPQNQKVAVDTLTLLAGNAGRVVLPYIEHPTLLPLLLSLLRSEPGSSSTKTPQRPAVSNGGDNEVPWQLQKSVLRCVGVLGSLDPHRYQLSQIALLQLKRNASMFNNERNNQLVGLATHERQANAHAAIQAALAAARNNRAGVLGVGSTDPNVSNVMATIGFDLGDDDEDDEVGGWWWRWAWAQDDDYDDESATLRDPASVIDGVDAVDPIMAAVEGIADEDTALSIKSTLAEGAQRGRLHLKSDGATGSTMLSESGLSIMGAANQGRSAASILPSNFAERDVYFSTVALTSLLRILSDPSLTDHHPTVLQAVTWIFRSLGQRCVKFLPHVVPAFLNILRQRVRSLREIGGAAALLGLKNKSDSIVAGSSQNPANSSGNASLREAILQQLGVLVLLVKEHMRTYLPRLFGLLHELWPASLAAVLRLVEHIALALPNEFNNYVPGILVHILATLQNPTDPLASSAEALARSARASGTGGYDSGTSSALTRYSTGGGTMTNDEGVDQAEAHGAKTDDSISRATPEQLLEKGVALCRHVLSTVASLGSLLEPYLDQLLPAILCLADRNDLPPALRRHAVVTLTKLARGGVSLVDHSSQILHCLSRIIAGHLAWAMPGRVYSYDTESSNIYSKSSKHQPDAKASSNTKALKRSACDLCCWVACQMREEFLVFVPLLRRALVASDTQHQTLEGLMSMLLGGIPLPPDPVDFAYVVSELSWRDWVPFLDLEDLKDIRENLGTEMLSLGSEVAVTRKQRENTLKTNFDGVGDETIDEDDEEYDHTNIDTDADSSAQDKVNAALGVVTGATVVEEGDGGNVGGNEGMEKLEVNEEALARAWDTEGRVTREDWVEWMRRLTVELLRYSPSPALRACWNPAQVYYPLARELFNAAFVSCWSEMRSPSQKHLLDAIETALHASKTPNEILHALLNLAEFMEHDEKALPMDIRTLGRLAEKCQAYAKALRYKEREYEQYLTGDGVSSNVSNSAGHRPQQTGNDDEGFGSTPSNVKTHSAIVESLIGINNQLEQPEAAIGILKYTQAQAAVGDRDTMGKLGIGVHTAPDVNQNTDAESRYFSWGLLEIKETWYEKLGRWEDALEAYNRKFAENYSTIQEGENGNLVRVSMPSHLTGFNTDKSASEAYVPLTLQLGRMRCLKALGEWVELQQSATELWPQLSVKESIDAVAPLAAQSSWALGDWKSMEMFSRYTQSKTMDGTLFRAVYSIYAHKFESAKSYIERARKLVSGNLSAVEAETYTRSYKSLVTVQQLTEMEEIIHYLRLRSAGEVEAAERYMQHVRPLWERRLKGCQQNADVWQNMLSVRALVRQTEEDLDSWIKFANLSRREHRVSMSRRILLGIGMDGNGGFQQGSASTVVETGGLACFPPPQNSQFPQSSSKRYVTGNAIPMLSSSVLKQSQQNSTDDKSSNNPNSPAVVGVGVTGAGYFDQPHSSRESAQSSASEVSASQSQHLRTPGWAVSTRQSPDGPMPHAYPVQVGTQGYDGASLDNQTYEGALVNNCVGMLGDIRPHPKVDFAFAKHLWASGSEFAAISHLTRLVTELDKAGGTKIEMGNYSHSLGERTTTADNEDMLPQIRRIDRSPYKYGFGSILDEETSRQLRMQCHLKLGEWKWYLMETHGTLDVHGSHNNSNAGTGAQEDTTTPKEGYAESEELSSRASFYRAQSSEDFMRILQSILGDYKASTDAVPRNYRAWHAWALANFQAAQRLHVSLSDTSAGDDKKNSGGKKSKPKRTSLGFGFNVLASRENQSSEESENQRRMVAAHVVPAVRGFFKSINLGRGRLRAHVLQDLLRLLTLWFTFGGTGQPEVRKELENGLASGFIGVDTWLAVVPQLIARIAIPDTEIRRLLHSLLIRVGVRHPQALVYPLTVAAKSTSSARQRSAMELLSSLRETHPLLIDQAQLVSEELIRVAILWHEEWHSALEEASKLHFTEKNTEGMLETLLPLHEKVARGGNTAHEMTFVQSYGRDLAKAHDWLKRYERHKDENDISAAWKIYYNVFKRIDNSLSQLKNIELQYVSQSLLSATNLKLAIPGTYSAGFPVVRIRAFSPSVAVIPSKQRPRKLTLAGSDGRMYTFLLKGHEDLRQDERAMQLFGLVNTLLANDAETSKRDLAIRRYSVTPLSHNAGIVGWVPNCDTLHSLIEEHRNSRMVLLNVEHRLMQAMAPMYDELTALQKVEVFRYALENTSGKDLDRVMWLKSLSSEMWLRRRTNFTRSLSVMSIVGYILGLGDRHPSNLMLDRTTGKVTHIDFGDCFEVAMRRDKFPEKIPFRLTRMLVNAMEVSGIEGNFRSTAEATMRVLRQHRDSVMAMLEAFVHDPLINWRLLGTNEEEKPSPSADQDEGRTEKGNEISQQDISQRDQDQGAAGQGTTDNVPPKRRGDRERELIQALGPEGMDAPAEALNDRAVQVLTRIKAKLTGRDFIDDPMSPRKKSSVLGNRSKEYYEQHGGEEAPRPSRKSATEAGRSGFGRASGDLEGNSLSVQSQVQRLVEHASSHENLSQLYVGWCPFW